MVVVSSHTILDMVHPLKKKKKTKINQTFLKYKKKKKKKTKGLMSATSKMNKGW
jgi:hypothetical protein